MSLNKNTPDMLKWYTTSNAAIDIKLDESTLRALESLKANVIRNSQTWNIEINFRDTSITKELQRAKMESLAKILMKESYEPWEELAITNLIHEDPRWVWIVLDSEIFRNRVVQWDKVVYTPNEAAIQEFRLKFFSELKDKPGLLKYDQNWELDLSPLHNPDTQLCYIQAFQSSFINFLKSKYWFSDWYATNVMNAMIVYYGWANIDIKNLSSATPAATENSDTYRQMVVNTIQSEFMSKNKFGALLQNKIWAEEVVNRWLIPWTFKNVNQWIVNWLDAVYNHTTWKNLTLDQKVSLEKLWVVAWTIWWLWFWYATFNKVRNVFKNKESKKTDKFLAVLGWLTLPLGVLWWTYLYTAINPKETKKVWELIFGPKANINNMTDRNLSRRDLSNNIFKDFAPSELEKYFNGSVEYSTTKYWVWDFNMDAFIEDYRKKHPNPSEEQKQFINDMVIVWSYPAGQINWHIIWILSTLWIKYEKDQNWKVSLSGSNLDQKLGERILVDKNMETSRQKINDVLQSAYNNFSQKTFEAWSQKSKDFETLKFNISNILSELNVAQNSSYIAWKNDFVDPANYENWRFKREVFMKKIWYYQSLAQEENEILNQLAWALTLAA